MVLRHEHIDVMNKTILERVVFKPPFRAETSMHNEACFLYVVNGQSRLYGPKESMNLSTSEGVVMKCGSYLNSWFSQEGEDANEAIAVHFYPEVLKMVFDDQIPEFLSASKRKNRAAIQPVQVDEMIEKYIESILFYFQNPSLATEELVKLKVKELILLLVNTDSSHQIRSILQDLFNPDQYEFKEIIHAHLFDNLSLQDLAVLTGLSLSSFKRKFSKVFNSSPVKYINTRRLEKAQRLLETTDLRVSEICFDCGFNDHGYFTRLFVSKYGSSPSDYRQQYLSQLS